jgi:hypothetical protein
MGNKITVEFKDKALYKDLQEIARLVKEPPEELLQRVFKEWIELREDLEDAEFIKESKARGADEDWVPHEQVMKELGLDKTPTP